MAEPAASGWEIRNGRSDGQDTAARMFPSTPATLYTQYTLGCPGIPGCL